VFFSDFKKMAQTISTSTLTVVHYKFSSDQEEEKFYAPHNYKSVSTYRLTPGHSVMIMLDQYNTVNHLVSRFNDNPGQTPPHTLVRYPGQEQLVLIVTNVNVNKATIYVPVTSTLHSLLSTPGIKNYFCSFINSNPIVRQEKPVAAVPPPPPPPPPPSRPLLPPLLLPPQVSSSTITMESTARRSNKRKWRPEEDPDSPCECNMSHENIHVDDDDDDDDDKNWRKPCWCKGCTQKIIIIS
jgi:hypothetical protein